MFSTPLSNLLLKRTQWQIENWADVAPHGDLPDLWAYSTCMAQARHCRHMGACVFMSALLMTHFHSGWLPATLSHLAKPSLNMGIFIFMFLRKIHDFQTQVWCTWSEKSAINQSSCLHFTVQLQRFTWSSLSSGVFTWMLQINHVGQAVSPKRAFPTTPRSPIQVSLSLSARPHSTGSAHGPRRKRSAGSGPRTWRLCLVSLKSDLFALLVCSSWSEWSTLIETTCGEIRTLRCVVNRGDTTADG